jgi:PEP-CTERM motif
MVFPRLHTAVATAAIALAATFASGVARADNLVVNVAGIQSFDELGAPLNVLRSYSLGAGAHITSVSWNVNLSSFGFSWLSELGVAFTNDAGDGVLFTPGFGDDFQGTGSYSGTADLTSLGLDFFLGSSGVLGLEFYEDFDDVAGAADGVWNSGTLTFGYTPVTTAPVPEPETYALMLAGLGVLGWTARRRKAI